MSLERIAKTIEKLVCVRVRELYIKYKGEGKELYAELVKTSFPECFPEEKA